MRVGVIGGGTISRNVHVPVLLAMPEASVAWIADTRVEARALADWSGARFHHVRGERLDLPPADMVLLAVPNGARAPYYEHLAGAGYGVYVEKPFARSRSEHALYAQGFNPGRIAVGLDRRSFGLTRLARRLFRQRPFGAPLSIRVEFGGLGRVLVGDSYMSDAQLAGGGALYQMGVHFIDAALFAADARDVTGGHGLLTISHGLDAHVEGSLDVELADGQSVPLQVLVTQFAAADNRVTFEFEHAAAALSIAYGVSSIEVTPTSGDGKFQVSPDDAAWPLDVFASFATHWRAAFRAFRTGEENYTSAGRTILTTKALELLYALPVEAHA